MYSLDDLLDCLNKNMIELFSALAGGFDRSFEDHVGYWFGYLSALALYQPQDATFALRFFSSLVRSSLESGYARLEVA